MAIRADSPLQRWERSGPTLTYSRVLVLGCAALGLGGILAVTSGSSGALGNALWTLALGLFGFSLAIGVVITLSFARRLEGLAADARRLSRASRSAASSEPTTDAIAVLAQSLGEMSDRIDVLTRELDQRGEAEQGRVDALVRERTRQLSEENADLRQLLGPSKAVLSIDMGGRIVGQASSVLGTWLGQVPEAGRFWDYFDRAGEGVASRFEAAWRDMLKGVPSEIDLRRMPKSLAIGERYLALDYQAVQAADGQLERLLVLLTDITVSEAALKTPA